MAKLTRLIFAYLHGTPRLRANYGPVTPSSSAVLVDGAPAPAMAPCARGLGHQHLTVAAPSSAAVAAATGSCMLFPFLGFAGNSHRGEDERYRPSYLQPIWKNIATYEDNKICITGTLNVIIIRTLTVQSYGKLDWVEIN